MTDKAADALRQLQSLATQLAARDENEAETRLKLINTILFDILAWPKNLVRVEEHIKPGYADYILRKSNGNELILIEAKKSGVYFSLPLPHKADETHCYLPISKLRSDPNIKAAIEQARSYCFENGCEFAAISNGHEWIFFKTFDRGKKWDHQSAFVIRSVEFFTRDYTKAFNNFSFIAVSENFSLANILNSSSPKDRTIYFAKDRIPSYSHAIAANRLAPTLRPIINKYFGVITDDDFEFMEKCYVSQREDSHAVDGMRAVIKDSLSPYFENYGIQQLKDTGGGGALSKRMSNSKKTSKGDVLILFGGKGAGKSTFLKRLLQHNPPPEIRNHSVTAIIDLLRVPEDTSVIRSHIWEQLVSALDRDNILEKNRDALIQILFGDRFKIASQQELAGLGKKSEAYNTRLNSLVTEWKSDAIYCSECLVNYWRNRRKGVIVVIDNTDQYSGTHQDFCFMTAQEIAAKLKCVTLISMREERFHNSKIHGVLDAFQNSGFHISSPRPADVFRKRLRFASDLMRQGRASFSDDTDDELIASCSDYLDIICKEFSDGQSPLNSFLTACAHGDTRLSLDLFRSFLLSGYTNVDEMLAAKKWTFQIHQVIKPVMIPQRYFYDEKLSEIPNIYQLRDRRVSSHFTGLRILRKLSKGSELTAPAYISAAELKQYFADTFGMLDDFAANADVLLQHGFIEADNRLDSYTDAVDNLKITSYGAFMFSELAYELTYLDLISVDCGVFNEGTSNFILEAAKSEYVLFTKDERVERVRLRLERVEGFLQYLADEEERERELFSLGMPKEDMFTFKSLAKFQEEKSRALHSAKRQAARRGASRRPGRRM